MTPRVYLDNAATTPVEARSLEAMMPYLSGMFGNPSSLHTFGREAKVAVEKARKSIAALLGTAPSQIFFTSGGTEADNTAICQAVRTLGIKHIITSSIEHHAVLHTIEAMHLRGEAEMHLVNLDADGQPDLTHLDDLLGEFGPALVSLMHGNNEIGNLNDLEAIGTLARSHGGYFHSDTVQTIGHFPIDLAKIPVDFIAGSAHKFHGPKGVGFLYVSERVKIAPYITGGAQERNMRGGTENVAGIMGMAAALDISCREMADHRAHIEHLKRTLRDELVRQMPDMQFNGLSADLDRSLYTVLNCSLPPSPINEMLLFRLDIAGICASGGSACSSGAQGGSHVLNALYPTSDRTGVRFSFSKYNTEADIHQAAQALTSLFAEVSVGV